MILDSKVNVKYTKNMSGWLEVTTSFAIFDGVGSKFVH